MSFTQFLQIGASRDGRELYLDAAKRRGMRAILVEMSEYIAYRRLLGRREFDETIAIEAPADPAAVLHALQGKVRAVDLLVLPGFERYSTCAAAVSAQCSGANGNHEAAFVPMDKAGQRAMLSLASPEILQPGYRLLRQGEKLHGSRLQYPLVAKPTDGGGGLGVIRVDDASRLRQALRYLRGLRNYDNSEFGGVILEQYVPGEECSLQGIMCSGECHVLSYCRKVIGLELISTVAALHGFREMAHIAVGAEQMPAHLLDFTAACMNAVSYHDGPFHVDCRNTSAGPVFLEMGFRLSGNAVSDLVRYVSGHDWGEVVFDWIISRRKPSPAIARTAACAAHILVYSESQIEAARSQAKKFNLRVEYISKPPTALSEEQRRLLRADISRHTGPIARILVLDADVAAVQEFVTHLQQPEKGKDDYEQQLEHSSI